MSTYLSTIPAVPPFGNLIDLLNLITNADACTTRLNDLNAAIATMQSMSDDLTTRESAVSTRESEVTDRETTVTAREASVTTAEATITARDADSLAKNNYATDRKTDIDALLAGLRSTTENI